VGLVILDACRNDPFRPRMTQSAGLTRTVTRGLGRVEPSGNLLVAFAAREGSVADDGSDRNSPFTTALLRHIEKPGLEVADLFREVRADVQEATGRRQEPAVYGSLGRERLFLAGLQPPAALPIARPADAALPLAPLIAVPPLAGPVADRSWTALRKAGWEVVLREGHGDSVRSVALSADGRFLVMGSDDNSARLWDVVSGAYLTKLQSMRTNGWLTLNLDGSIHALDGNEDELYSLARGLEVRSPSQMRAEGWELPTREPPTRQSQAR
jgi:hypothetical protein